MRLAKPPSVMVKTYCSATSVESSTVALDGLLGRDLLGADHRHREQRVAVAELHPAHTAGGTAHRAQLVVVGGEPDRLALAGDQQDVVVGVDQLGADQLVVLLAEVDRDHAGLARAVVVGEVGLLDQARTRGEHEVRRLLVVADRQHLRDLLVGLEGEQAGHVTALGVARGLGQVVGLGAVDPSGRGEEQQPVVVGGGHEVLRRRRRPCRVAPRTPLPPRRWVR